MTNERPHSPEIEAAILREQVHITLRHLPTVQSAAVVVGAVLCYSVRALVPSSNIVLWMLLLFAIAASRIVYYYRYARVRSLPFDGERFKNAYVALAVISGSVWGLSAFLIFPSGNIGLIALFVLVIASLSAATTVSHSSLRFGAVAWMTPALLFYAVRCFLEGGETTITIGVLIIIYYATLVSFSLNHYRAITASIAVRFENQRLLEDVRKSEERFRLLFQRHNAIMLLIDPESGDIVDANAAAEAHYGYPAGQLKRMNLRDINMLTSAEIWSARQRAMREECNYFIFPHRLANGDVRTVEVHSAPIQTGDRALLFSIIHDITERRLAEERLRESERNYRNLFNSMNDAIYLLDGEGRIVDVNRGAEALFREPRDFFLRRTLAELSRPAMNDSEALAAAVARAFAGESLQLDLRSERSDGTEVPQEVRLMPAAYGGHRVVMAVARDASERKRIEAEMLKSQKLEAIGVLAGGIAHDFNNLLQAMFSYVAVARRRIDQRDKAVLMLEKTEKALQLSVNLTSQLLTFSKGGKPVTRPLALGPVIETAARFALSGSRSDCRFSFSDGLWAVEADEGQIGQVVQNIVLNAVQAMPSGGVVTVAAANEDLRSAAASSVPGPGKWVRITVRDTGAGIPKEHLQRIFEPYFTTKETGSGLGLATSYSIVRNHGGVLEAESVENSGSTFTIWLPAAEAAAPVPARSEAPAALRRGRVLVMDDEEVVRDSVGEMLDELGQEVVLASDGAAAIEQYVAARAAGAPFQLVILDATVRGGMGGEETMRRLRSVDPDVYAVISSGYSDEAVVARHAEHGFRAFLPKPFTYESLQAVLGASMDP